MAGTLRRMRHVVWDWNGTLLADQLVAVEALNVVCARAGVTVLTAEQVRQMNTRPLRRFYERLFARPITDAEWARIDDVFHDAWRAAVARVALATDAVVALEAVTAAGRTQSLLSMLRHDDLVPLLAGFEIDHHFVRVDGLRELSTGGGKAEYLVAHLERVRHTWTDATDVLVIGDTLDDARAAAHVGARCVLYDGGTHTAADLDAAGVPVATSLVEALDLAGAA